MPTNGTFSGAPIPTVDEANNASSILAAYDAIIGARLVLPATSQADRDAKYGNLPAGALVSCASLQTVWMKTTTPPTAAAWVTLCQVLPAVTSGFLGGRSGFSVVSQWAQVRDGRVDWRAQLTWSGSTISAGSNGDLNPDVRVATIQSPYLPAGNGDWPIVVQAHTATGAGHVQTIANPSSDINSGDVYLTSLAGGSSISSGQFVKIGGSYPLAGV